MSTSYSVPFTIFSVVVVVGLGAFIYNNRASISEEGTKLISDTKQKINGYRNVGAQFGGKYKSKRNRNIKNKSRKH
jgi:hypothetical protein